MFTKKTILIIPTKDRPKKISKTINAIKKNQINFKKILIIDSSQFFLKNNIKLYNKFNIEYITSRPSISFQRNIGIKFAKNYNGIKFIMFLDDDIIIKKKSFLEMDYAIKRNAKNNKIAGFAFSNKVNFKSFFDKIKNSQIIEKINLYHSHPGKILSSGWQTKLGSVKKDTVVEWLSFAAAVFYLKDIRNKKFDESFGKYSYLEDLDMSLQFKTKKFLLISKANYFHLEDIDRKTFKFGKYEVLNRYKIVSRHNLSTISFYKTMILKVILNFLKIFKGDFLYIFKFFGNIYALLILFMQKIK